MTSDRRIFARQGAAMACCLAALAFLAPGNARAGVVGSKHDFTGTLIPGRSSLTATGVCSACHIAHSGEPEKLWTTKFLRTLAEERLYFNQTSAPNYAAGFTILCYDCHDNHKTTGGVDNSPQDAWFNASRLPQDVAFDDYMNILPRDGMNNDDIPGYYENIPSRTAGYPASGSTYVSGHYVKSPVSGGALVKGDKLPCSDCHNPHSNANQAFIRTDLAGKSLSGKVASTNMAYSYTEVPAGRDDNLSRELCITCHGTSEQTTYTAVTFNAINPSYAITTIAKPPAGINEHLSTSTMACTDCHSHNNPDISCYNCHGTNASESLQPGAIRGQIWPDGAGVNPLYLYADNEPGAHLRHVAAIAMDLYGETAAQVVTETGNGTGGAKQIAICTFCHLSPGGGGHEVNDGTAPSGADRVDVRSGLAGDRFKAFTVGANAYGDDTNIVANYSFATKTCSGSDCHYEYATPLYVSGGWDSADAAGNEPNCRTCHYFRDATSGSGPGTTAVWTPATPQLPDAHQTHVGGIAPPNNAQSHSYLCSYCHPIPGATNHANGDIDLSTAGNPTLSKEATPAADESMTPGSYAVKFGVGAANTTCANMYCHGADFGQVADTETATRGTNFSIPVVWNNHLSGACGTCHDVDPRITTPRIGQTFSEGSHQLHLNLAVYGPRLNHNECAVCHGVANVGAALLPGCAATVCHPNGGLSVPGDDDFDRGWAAFPSRNHVQGNFEINFENQDRGFNNLYDYDATPGTVAVFGTAPLFTGGTDICSRCHSTANIVFTNGYLIAKTNWNTPAFRLDCRTCHNSTDPAESTPVINGVAAPAKDAYFTTRGHGNNTTYPWAPNRAGADLTCISCHNMELAHINGTLAEDRLTTPGNTLCTTCHDGPGVQPGTTQVSTHGNRSTTMLSKYNPQRAAFELNCMECHDVHGSTNIFMVNTVNPDGPLINPTRWYNGAVNTTTFLYRTSTTVAFTLNTNGSDYAVTVANANKICQTCHTTTGDGDASPVYKYNAATTGHPTAKCTGCHKHDVDNNFDPLTSQDGFMPSGCLGCHGNPPNAGCDNLPGTADDAPNVVGNGTNPDGTGLPPKPFDDGTWGYNVNGHGANGSRIPSLTPNLDCNVCHDLNSPSPNKHYDCTLTENVNQRLNTRFYFGKAADTRNANTSHLVAGYLAGLNNPQAKQIGFDDYCYATAGCHQTNGVRDHRHGDHPDGIPDKIMQFSTVNDVTYDPKYDRGSPAANIDWTPWTIDDLTNVVDANPPGGALHHGVCVSCHDPHGTDVAPVLPSIIPNHMYIQNFNNNNITNPACSNCHRP